MGIFLAFAAAAARVPLTDDLGRTVTLPAPARRIVTLAPSATEIVYAAGAGKRLVGVSSYSNWPPGARHLPRVGDAYGIDLERIAALRPNLVIAWASAMPLGAREALGRLGLPLLLFAPRQLSDIAREIRLVGRAAGTEEIADKSAAAFLRKRAHLAARYERRRPVRVFYEISAKPLYTVGGKQIISQVLHLCAGHNIFSGIGTLAPTVSRAAVLARNPQVILTGSGKRATQRLDAWKRWPWLAAVRRGNLFVIPGDALGRPAPKVLDAAAVVCRDIQQARRRLQAQRGG